MSLLVRGSVCAVLALSLGAGCAHMIESRAIDQFAKNLQSENLEGLKESTSDHFSERALRTATALQDIKILRLPDGKTTIVDVESLSEDQRRVTVQVGSEKKEVFYELIRDPSGKWVVDEVYLKQKKQGVTAFKSVTDQLDLLLTVREFLDGWDAGKREQMLQICTLEFRASLERLPPAFLAELTKDVIGEKSLTSPYKPRAQLDESTAVVRLPRTGGETVLTLNRENDAWQVADVAVDARVEEDRIPSIYKLSLAVNTCTDFLEAYAREDKPALAPLCVKDFYDGCLGIANLKQVLLPAPDLIDHQLDVRLNGMRADFLLKGDAEIVQIDMRREDAAEPNAPPTFRVNDVTIYEVETKQEKRLAALFTAQGMLELFCRALADRDLDDLRHTSSQEFSNQVWRRLNSATIQGLPLEQFDNPELQITSTRFLGSLTRVEAQQGGQPVTYMLREESGRFFVDDVQWQVSGRPGSVKETLSLLVPVQNFAAAVALSRDPAQQKMVLEMLQDTCSTDFNRMVWQQADFVPNSGLGADTFLSAPLRSIVQSDTSILIQLGDDRFGASVRLRKEQNRELIDDVELIGGPEVADRIPMKQTLRTLLATGEAIRPGAQTQFAAKPAPRKIEHAVYEEFSDEPLREVLHASDVIDTSPGVQPAVFTDQSEPE